MSDNIDPEHQAIMPVPINDAMDATEKVLKPEELSSLMTFPSLMTVLA